MSRRAHPVAAVALGGYLWEQARRWYRPPYTGPRLCPLGLGEVTAPNHYAASALATVDA